MGVMGLIMERDGPAGGYESVPLLIPGAVGDEQGSGVAVLRWRSARPSRRAVLYVHCLEDTFVPADLAAWYTERGFHFYAADLRSVGAGEPAPADGNRAASELNACFGCLDAAVTHLRAADAIDTVVAAGHCAGAVITALWCHARRGSQPVDALIIASPDLGPAWPWLARPRPGRADGTSGRPASPLLASAQRRLRRGLEIACPVLVMSQAGAGDAAGPAGRLLSLGTFGVLAGQRATVRLGEHVTWLTLDAGLPDSEPVTSPQRRRLFDEMGRWLGAYLSGQIRDQLL